MIFAIVLGGGTGARMLSELPKQYLKLYRKPVAYYAINAFYSYDKIDKVIFVTSNNYFDYGVEISQKYFNSDVLVCTGGRHRYDSLMRGVEFIEEQFGLDEDTIVLTHDAARPFVSERMIRENIEAMQQADACDTCIAAVDTVIEGEGGFATAMPDREKMYYCQTPQTFKAAKLKQLFLSLSDEQKAGLTDAGKIFHLCGEKVKIVEGDRNNIKITYPIDLEIAKSIMRK
ncbi:MAG: 2-C-methyl-D-erythritol 4-phosphate cytidylyltransferase [Clostridia bacterium]|nr:2-C-methyl-D-erythritol 4-phosphate cytidylyltransferase [Clostridia bacterium]